VTGVQITLRSSMTAERTKQRSASWHKPGDSRDRTSPTVGLTMMAEGPEFDLVTGSLDPESDLIWIVGTLSTDDATFHIAAWGQPDEEFLF
jgi:hypothetical protein